MVLLGTNAGPSALSECIVGSCVTKKHSAGEEMAELEREICEVYLCRSAC